MAQPPGFESDEFPNHVYKLDKALYGLKQAPRAWYERLSKYLLENGFKRGLIDKTLFIKTKGKDILVVQIYVDDILFGATNTSLCKEFSDIMCSEFEMSLMGELNFFLGLQVHQSKRGIFVNQSKYTKDLLKKFKMDQSKAAKTPMSSTLSLDQDKTGYKVDRKSTSGCCQLLGASLISWYSKKQNSVALSTAEAEYIAAGACCSQILWTAQQLRDLGIDLKGVPIK